MGWKTYDYSGDTVSLPVHQTDLFTAHAFEFNYETLEVNQSITSRGVNKMDRHQIVSCLVTYVARLKLCHVRNIFAWSHS